MLSQMELFLDFLLSIILRWFALNSFAHLKKSQFVSFPVGQLTNGVYFDYVTCKKPQVLKQTVLSPITS